MTIATLHRGDFDILIEAYVVNASRVPGYIRDFRLTIDIDEKPVPTKLERDFRSALFGDPAEYALARQDGTDAEPLPSLYGFIHTEIQPNMPIEGWLRFSIKDVSEEQVNGKPIRLEVVDSVGKHHPIHNAVQKQRTQEITVRSIGRR